MFNVLDSLKPHAHWLLRIGLAGVFLYHGIGKVMDLGGFSQMMGLPTAVAALVTLAEVAGGVGIIVGAFTNDLITRWPGLLSRPSCSVPYSWCTGVDGTFHLPKDFPWAGWNFKWCCFSRRSIFS